jgi:hypothetical protein
MRTFVQRWWIFFAAIAVGVLVAWSAGKVFPPPIFALFVIASTVVLFGILRWREGVWRQKARVELIEHLVDMPVYLTSELWESAVTMGLVRPEDMADIRKRQDERRAAQRAEEERA